MRNAVFFGLWLIYYFFFWQEGIGLNLVLFALLLNLSSRIFQSNLSLRKGEWPYLLAFVLSAFGIIFFNSAISIVSFIMLNVAYLSFVWGAELSVSEHFANGLIRIFNVQKAILPERLLRKSSSARGVYSVLRLSLVPLAVFLVFFALFRAGNPIFKEWSNGLTFMFQNLFVDFSWPLFWFMVMGLLILRMVFLQNKSWPMVFKIGDRLQRGRSTTYKRIFPINGLRREYRMALMTFISLNALLLVVNLIDIRWFWFGFEMPQNFSLKEFLHEGVAFLIASLLLAASVVFYFFRNSLNFYPNEKWLGILAKVWIVQNAVLAVSVLLRTYYYIDFHGLANGRIIVVSIISVVLVGLYLLYRKVEGKRSHAYVFRYVSMYVMLMFGLMSVWDWDRSIASFNLAHGRINEIDVDNYLNMHPRVYPLIYENLDRVETQIKAHQNNEDRWIRSSDLASFEQALGDRRRNYLKREASEGLWSWNMADAKAVRDLNQISKL